MNLLALFSKLYYVKKIHIILVIVQNLKLIYNFSNFNKIEWWQYTQLQLQFYNFTIQLKL